MTPSLLSRPIPPRPAYFGPDGVPSSAFDARLNAYEYLNDGFAWLASRPTTKPRVGVVHTNASSWEASTLSSEAWGRRTDTDQGRNTTKPHYNFGGPRPAKSLRTDLRAIANSTGDAIERQYNEIDSSFWTIAFETRDSGVRVDPSVSDFLQDDAELIAQAIAYESIVHGIPVRIPDKWNGSGWVTHTWPWAYPYFTTAPGKICPGEKKKATFREVIMPRALQIWKAWTNQEEEDDMNYLPEPTRVHDSRGGAGKLRPGTPRKVPIGMATKAILRVTVVNAEGNGTRNDFVSASSTNALTNPCVNMWDGKKGDGIAFTALDEGNVYLATTVACDVIVDVMALG